MFERFTDLARHVIVVAQEEARSLGHNYIGTEHLIIALIAVGEGAAFKAMHSCGLDVDRLRESVLEQSPGNDQVQGHIAFTPATKRVLEQSLQEALQLGHTYIGTEHILLALSRDDEFTGIKVIKQCGVEARQLRHALIAQLNGTAGTPASVGDDVVPPSVQTREKSATPPPPIRSELAFQPSPEDGIEVNFLMRREQLEEARRWYTDLEMTTPDVVQDIFTHIADAMD